ncbi:MAG: DegT/DnrJ/EryC1/StrS family aminotransferase [Blastochloris sp.]|nr:DegT/DnrJ/EryC1/StrS family aminotransferase [Blastochloris sp.]
MTTVPLIKPDLPPFAALEEGFREILENGQITNFGKYVRAFEESVTAFLGVETVTVSSGTAGLILALQAAGLQPGDKVIVPSFTFMATAQAVLYAGGIPVFAEIEPELTMAIDDLAHLLAQHPAATMVIPVHTFGLPAHTTELQNVVTDASQRYSRPISLIYDAAHAFGSARDGQCVGTFGDAEVFSLSATKVLVAVEGGLVSSRNPELIARIRHMRNYGIQARYNAGLPGLNGKMSEFHALVGLHNLPQIPAFLTQRAQTACYFRHQVQTRTPFELLPWPEGVTHTFKDFVVLVPRTYLEQRNEIMSCLKELGIETRAYFDPPLHRQQHFQGYVDRPLPRTDEAAQRVITLPFFTTMTEAQVDTVVDALAQVGY